VGIEVVRSRTANAYENARHRCWGAVGANSPTGCATRQLSGAEHGAQDPRSQFHVWYGYATRRPMVPQFSTFATRVRTKGHQTICQTFDRAWGSGEGRVAHPSVLSPGGLSTALTWVPADLCADPTESQRGCLCMPHGALDPAILNTRCLHVPAPAPRSRDLEMRCTASSGIEGSNPSRSGFSLVDKAFGPPTLQNIASKPTQEWLGSEFRRRRPGELHGPRSRRVSGRFRRRRARATLTPTG
jgi:hypothetical protein